MKINLSRVEARLRDRICPNCVRFTSDRKCSLPPDRDCPIFANLRVIAQIVERTDAASVGPYLEEVRSNICAACREDEQGICPLRCACDCALDTYLPMIVDEIEVELDLQARDRASHIRSFN